MTELEAIRDLLTPGLLPIAGRMPLVPSTWKWRPVLSLDVEGDGIVLRIPGIDEAFPIVMAEEIPEGIYKDRFRPRILGAMAQARMIFSGREEPKEEVG